MNEPKWSKISFYLLIICENIGLTSLYFLQSHHEQWMTVCGSILVCVFTFVGILLREAGNIPSLNSPSKDEEQQAEMGTKEPVVDNDSEILTSVEVIAKTKDLNSCDEINNEALNERNKNRDTMCSIQDLLANTSIMKNLYEVDSSSVPVCTTPDANDSIHQVGLPVLQNESLNASDRSSPYNACQRTPSPSDSRVSSEVMRITCSQSSNYENIYDAVNAEEISVNTSRVIHDSHTVRSCDSNLLEVLDCKTLSSNDSKISQSYETKLLVPVKQLPNYNGIPLCNQSLVTETSHDYENVLSLNVYRADTGVRHWKGYLDIEDHVHDYSTFKDRSIIQDSTIISSFYSKGRPGIYSISLPDLSNIEALTIEATDDELPESPNYEAIWYNSNEDNEEDSKAKESLCNLYYSSLADLSSKYFYDDLKKAQLPWDIKEVSGQKLTGISTAVCPEPTQPVPISSQTQTTPMKPIGRMSSLKRAQKSPIIKLMSRSHASLQEGTSKVLQVGKRVFYKPRIHVITPKKDPNHYIRPSRASHTRIDPYIIRRRADLSPKDKLILSEASCLIKKNSAPSSAVAPIERNQVPFITPAAKKPAERQRVSESCDDGPQHSTPESDRHLPQMSILSTISSVHSPEESLYGNRTQSASSLHFSLKTLATSDGKRCSAKQLEEMSVIKESSCVSIPL